MSKRGEKKSAAARKNMSIAQKLRWKKIKEGVATQQTQVHTFAAVPTKNTNELFGEAFAGLVEKQVHLALIKMLEKANGDD